MRHWFWIRWVLLIVLAAALIGAEFWLRHVRPIHLPSADVLWVYQSPEAGSILSSPCIDGDSIYVGAIRDTGFSPHGEVVALDRETGKPDWKFDDGGEMLQMYSSPRPAGGRLYIGEGMHANFTCKLYCIDIQTRKKLWSFSANGHIESTPTVENGLVYFGAGDDGLYALDANSGMPRWHFDKALHIDSNPAVVGGRVYAGAGVSRKYAETCVLCLDAKSGREIWREHVDLPAWGSPLVDGNRIYIGLGNGRLDESDAHPAGAVICLDAGNGKKIWRTPLGDSMMSRPTPVDDHICATCRDGGCYLLDRENGNVIWRNDLHSPIVTNSVYVDGKIYVAASGGLLACLNPANGETEWSFDTAAHAHAQVNLFSTPAVITDELGRASIYFGAELVSPAGRVGALYAIKK